MCFLNLLVIRVKMKEAHLLVFLIIDVLLNNGNGILIKASRCFSYGEKVVCFMLISFHGFYYQCTFSLSL
jgi:hypothetical protein